MSEPAIEPAYLTAADVAALLQVDARSVLRWASSDASMRPCVSVAWSGSSARRCFAGSRGDGRGARHRHRQNSRRPADGAERYEKLVRSARLIAELIALGCKPIRTNADGSAIFSRTDTVLRIIKEYTDRVDMARARQSFRTHRASPRGSP